MFNLNRRHTEALEKTARAEERAAKAEETIARHLGEFLHDKGLPGDSKPTRPLKNVTPPKNQTPRR
jgi:hypothetical protein